MFGWHEALILAILAGIVITIAIIVILLLRRRRNSVSNHRGIVTEQETGRSTTPSELKTTSSPVTEVNSKRRLTPHFLRKGSSTKSFFNWADHPTLITDAVENGWSRFAFITTSYVSSSPSVRSLSSFLGSLRVAEDHCHTNGINSISLVEESWVIGAGSVELMQKITFRGGGGGGGSGGGGAVVRMALPLPGPSMVKSFPEEAYFEITVLSSSEDSGKSSIGEGEKTKLLIDQQKISSVGMGKYVRTSRGSHLLDDLKIGGGGRSIGGGSNGGGGGVKMSIGMSVGGVVTTRMPGSYPGSIGFYSDGSIFLGGIKLVFESEKEDWAKNGKVIGCGFSPKEKKVYFTVDSNLVHAIHCKSEDFGTPLYPVVATNMDITLLVNLGQSSFSYPPANAHRTPNPCFIHPAVNLSASAFGYEDSRELFSMGRIDAEWLSHSATTKSTVSNSSDFYSNSRNSKMNEYEDEFIEIVLDYSGK